MDDLVRHSMFRSEITRHHQERKGRSRILFRLRKKDWHMLELILADEFTFTSPAGDNHISLRQFKERCWPNAENTRKFDLEKVLVAGDDAFVTYNGWTNDGRLFRNTERFRLKEGR